MRSRLSRTWSRHPSLWDWLLTDRALGNRSISLGSRRHVRGERIRKRGTCRTTAIFGIISSRDTAPCSSGRPRADRCGLRRSRLLSSYRCGLGLPPGMVVVGDLVGSGEAQERGIVGETPNLAGTPSRHRRGRTRSVIWPRPPAGCWAISFELAGPRGQRRSRGSPGR